MKSLSILLLALYFAIGLYTSHVNAQCLQREYGFTHSIGSPERQAASGVTIDKEGNLYVVGGIQGKVDFDPSKRKDKFKSKGISDIFITSYTAEGVYRWTGVMGGSGSEGAFSVAVTPQSDVVIVGNFQNKVDLDPTKGKDKHKAASEDTSDAFVTLLHSDGTYGWSRTFGGIQSDVPFGVTVDHAGNILLAGRFLECVDFDPGRGVDKHTSNGFNDVFVTKLSRNGGYQWTRTFGGPRFDIGFNVATDADNNIFVTGQFFDTVDFDSGEGEDIHESEGEQDGFITKLDPEGSYQWTHTFGGIVFDVGSDVVTDNTGNVYVTGFFYDEVDFDRRGDGDIHTSNGSADVFVTKRAADGSYQWTKTFGGIGSDAANAIDLDDSGVIIVGGLFADTVDFDFTEGVDEYTVHGGRDVFLTRMTTDGGYGFTDTFGGTDGSEALFGLDIGSDGSVVACGDFTSTDADFDPTSGVDEHGAIGKFDFYVTKHYCGQCEFIERHTVTTKKKNITSTVRAIAEGGKVTVKCKGTENVTKSSKIKGDTAKIKFKNLKKGQYECTITKLKYADGQVLCNDKTSARNVTIE